MQIIQVYDQLALVYASEKVLTTTERYLKEQETFVKRAIESGLATPIERKRIELAQQQLEGKRLDFHHNKTLLVEQLNQLTGEDKEQLRLMVPQLQSIGIDKMMEGEKRRSEEHTSELQSRP